MGLSNYQFALRKKFSALSGERELLLERIERIKQDQTELPELEARAVKLETLVQSAAELLTEENSDWSAEQSPPVRHKEHKLPIPLGTCGRRAMEVLRTADKAMTVREVTLAVLHQVNVTNPDRATVQRAHNAVDASLRHHRGKGVESSDSYPAQWRSMARPEIVFDP